MRIISLLASATEMIAALGCLDQLVGRSHECDYPPQVQMLPVVSTVQINIDTSSQQIDTQIKRLAQEATDTNALKALSIYTIDVEQLQNLRPDIIFTQTQCEVCAVSERDVIQALQHLTGLQPQVISLTPYRLSDVWEDVVRVGKALGRHAEAVALVQGYQQRLEQLSTITTRLGEGKPKPRVGVLEWLDPLMGAGNWTPELVAYAGGENVFGESGQHAPWLTWEELQVADPDILVLVPCGFTLARTRVDIEILQKHSAWHTLRAVRNGCVYAIDGNDYINRSGPRLVESAEIIGYTLWGEGIGRSIDANSWQRVQ